MYHSPKQLASIYNLLRHHKSGYVLFFRLTLSFSDLSCWCYGCSEYLDNEILHPFKNLLHKHKFDGQELPKTEHNSPLTMTATLEIVESDAKENKN